MGPHLRSFQHWGGMLRALQPASVHFFQISWLQEKATSSKLEMLYSQSLYILALNLAKTQGLDAASVADIHRQYGDHQYSKGNYDGAMQQYVQTIGQLQPSYVIRKVETYSYYSTNVTDGFLIVLGCTTHPQPRHIPTGVTLTWPR